MTTREWAEEEAVSEVYQTRELFNLDNDDKPKYLSSITTIKGQSRIEHGSQLVAKPRQKRNVFSLTEKPRSVSANSKTPTPSWFRYANIDGPEQNYAPMPPGYHWEVDYYRREDGVLITKPGLARIPSLELRPPKKPRLDDYARAMDVDIEDLTDCGIEDISSDEEMYTRRSHIFDAEDDEERDGGSLSIRRIRPAPTLLPHKSPRNTSPSTTASVISLSQSPELTLPPPTPTGSTSIMAPELAFYPSSRAHMKRIDSRHVSLSPTSNEFQAEEDGDEDDPGTDNGNVDESAQEFLAQPDNDDDIQPHDIDGNREVEGGDGYGSED